MIDRKQALWGITSDEDRFFMSKMCDLAQKSENTGRVMYSRFLSPAQVMLLNERLSFDGEVKLFGGFEDAERLVAAFVPFFQEEPSYPICVLKLTPANKKVYSHRDYLGAVLSLGIDRELTGDIIITEKCAYMFVTKDIAQFIELNLTGVANTSLKVCLADEKADLAFKRQFKETSATVSSLRFDCVLSSALGKSRAAVSSFIEEGLASVNHSIVKSTTLKIKDKDVISVRGFGKIIVSIDGFVTKKGRIHINFKKYL